jgi:hypothetical protein
MPNRILREGILESERIHKIGPMAELFYRRLMSIVDDYGRYAYDIPVLLSRCFPRRPSWADEEAITLWSGECSEAGLLTIYEVNKHKYLEISDFRQPIRSRSKWPDLSSGCIADATQMQTDIDKGRFDPHTDTNTNTDSEGQIVTEVVLQQREWFEEFWGLYWRKVSKKPAFEAYRRKVLTEDCRRLVVSALQAQSPAMLARDPSIRPHAATWINQERWNDEIEPVSVNGHKKRGLSAEEIAAL